MTPHIKQGIVMHLTLLGLLLNPVGSGLQAETVEFNGNLFWVYHYDPAKEKLELFLGEPQGKPNTFTGLEKRLNAQGRQLKFAMNSGIFEGTFFPSGLHISEGKTITKLNLKDFKKTREGELTPNFFLKPNGVFFLRKDGSAAVVESLRYSQLSESPVLATQSGPMLVGEGKIHPVLTKDSTSKRYRNGVGVTKDGKIIFACSHLNVETGMSNLYNFAAFFRDKLGCPNALYLDGDISYIFIRGETPALRETNWFSGILAVTEEKKK